MKVLIARISKKELNTLPIIPEEFKPKYKIIKSMKPTDEEIEKNNRARSSMLRVIEVLRF